MVCGEYLDIKLFYHVVRSVVTPYGYINAMSNLCRPTKNNSEGPQYCNSSLEFNVTAIKVFIYKVCITFKLYPTINEHPPSNNLEEVVRCT